MWLWILLGIFGFIILLITVILLLPVKVLIKQDEQGNLMLLYKFLFKTFGEDPDPNDPVVRMLKTATGVDRLEKTAVKESIRSKGLKKTLKENYNMLVELCKELLRLLGYCSVSRLHITIRSAGEDVDDAAIHYGACCTATYGLLNVLRGFMKVRERGCKIDISCGFFETESVFQYDVVLITRVGRVLAGLWRTAKEELRRREAQRARQQVRKPNPGNQRK